MFWENNVSSLSKVKNEQAPIVLATPIVPKGREVWAAAVVTVFDDSSVSYGSLGDLVEGL